MKKFCVVLALALFGCSGVDAPTSIEQTRLAPGGPGKAVIVNETTPVSLAIVACNGEEVTATGSMHFIYEETQAANGSYHGRVTNTYTFSGTGLVTGAKYQGGARFVTKEILNVNAATVFSIDASVRLIGQGNVPNSWLDNSTSFTVNANGDVTREDTTFETRCQD